MCVFVFMKEEKKERNRERPIHTATSSFKHFVMILLAEKCSELPHVFGNFI